MTVRKSLVGTWLGLAAGAALVVSGCGKGDSSSDQARQVPGLKQLGLFYSLYKSRHQGNAPANEAEFKQYVTSQHAEQLKQLGIENVDSMFVSPRDGKPYVIQYGRKSGPGGNPPAAWEQDGKAGKRFVVDSMGKLDELDEAAFKRLVPASPGK